ncbi:hypothetical protein [Polaromonas sp. CG9_12]|nr:hypothetical protein [Polaromonas sp. CG9_12]
MTRWRSDGQATMIFKEKNGFCAIWASADSYFLYSKISAYPHGTPSCAACAWCLQTAISADGIAVDWTDAIHPRLAKTRHRGHRRLGWRG